ncbi:MAG TPA: hypothetical protein VGJ31_03085 [Dongiaceae bacterium]|jgi:hypothetical protein
MSVLKQALTEFTGLFVDDRNLAALTLVLIAADVALVKLAGLSPLWGAYLLLLGCLAILAESVFRARR